MIDRLRQLFGSRADTKSRFTQRQRAAAALLAEAARADGAIKPRERSTIERALARRFALGPWDAARLAQEGEAAAADSTQIFEFTRVLNRDVPPEDRVALFEMLYEVIYADDAQHDVEASLMRRLGELIYLPDKERGAARLRVLARLGKSETR